MELLLREDVPNLGRAGTVVKVKSGYGRNFLLPKKLAMPVNPENMRLVELRKKELIKEMELKLADFKELGAKLKDATVKIAAKVAEGGHLYGSVTQANIAEALTQAGFPVEEKAVRLDSHIKELGTYPVLIHLHPEVEATAHVVVVEEE